LTSVGPKWFSLYFNPIDDVNAALTISATTVPLDVYISTGWTSDPNSYEFDAKFSSVTEILSLNVAKFKSLMGSEDGFTVSIYVQGIDIKENKLLENSFRATLGPSILL